MVARWTFRQFSLVVAAACAAPGEIDDVACDLLRAALDGLDTERQVCCENIANVDTPRFKRLVVQRVGIGDGPDGGLQMPRIEAIVPIWTQVALEITGRALDVAIEGEGPFGVVLADGTCGYIVRNDLGGADILLPEVANPIDTLEISIAPDGVVSGRTAGSPDSATGFGQFLLHRFGDADCPGRLLSALASWAP